MAGEKCWDREQEEGNQPTHKIYAMFSSGFSEVERKTAFTRVFANEETEDKLDFFHLPTLYHFFS